MVVPVLDQATEEELFAEIRRRGFQIVPKRSVREGKWVEVSKPTVDEASMDFDKWMGLVQSLEHLINAPARYDGALGDRALQQAMLILIDLLQPPSVREARKSAAHPQ